MMASDQTPSLPPIPPPVPGRGGPSREEDIANTLRAGQERTEKEAALRQKLKEKHAENEAQSRTALLGVEEKRAQEKARKKGYRASLSARDREAEDDKVRREKQEKLVTEEKQKFSQKRKKEQESLQELHDTAAVKFAAEQKKNTAKRAEEAEKQKTEKEYRAKLSQAEQAERAAIESIERDVRSRRGIVDGETREKLFKLESLKRLKTRELENMTNRELAAAKSADLFAFERKRAAIETLARARRRRADAEIAEKEQAIRAEDRTQKIAIDADAKTERDAAATERQRAVQDADRWYARRMNDSGRRGKE